MVPAAGHPCTLFFHAAAHLAPLTSLGPQPSQLHKQRGTQPSQRASSCVPAGRAGRPSCSYSNCFNGPRHPALPHYVHHGTGLHQRLQLPAARALLGSAQHRAQRLCGHEGWKRARPHCAEVCVRSLFSTCKRQCGVKRETATNVWKAERSVLGRNLDSARGSSDTRQSQSR